MTNHSDTTCLKCGLASIPDNAQRTGDKGRMSSTTQTWEEEFDKRFVWSHTPEGRGFLFDEIGQQSVDEVIMKGLIRSLLLSQQDRLVKAVEGLEKASLDKGRECSDSDIAYNQALDDILQIIKQEI